jgi:hypothetical protein
MVQEAIISNRIQFDTRGCKVLEPLDPAWSIKCTGHLAEWFTNKMHHTAIAMTQSQSNAQPHSTCGAEVLQPHCRQNMPSRSNVQEHLDPCSHSDQPK